MTTIVCRICLRTSSRTKDMDENLVFFHDEICDFVVLNNSVLSFCTICEHKLRKFYNFKMKCQRAYLILRTKKDALKKKEIWDLYKLMPPDSIGLSTPRDRQGVFSYSSEVEPSPLENYNVVPYIQVPSDTLRVKSEAEKSHDIKVEKDPELLAEQILAEDNDSTTGYNELEFLELSDLQEYDDFDPIKTECDVDNTDESKLSKIEQSLENDSKLISRKKPKTQRIRRPKSKKLIEKTEADNISLSDILTKKQLTFLSRLNISKPAKEVLKTEKGMLSLKERALDLIEEDNLVIEGVTLTKELFLKMLANCDEDEIKRQGVFKRDGDAPYRLKKFLRYLVKRFNPEYDSVFHMDYFTTRDMKLAEFNARKENKLYLEAEFKCQICYRWFEKKTMLEYHNQWHDASRQHACDICSMRFSTRPHLKNHLRTHYCLYRCKLCDVVTNSFLTMQNHFHSHKGMRYTCDVCSSEYRSRSALNTHLLMHATHPCPICGYRFKSTNGLAYHMKVKHKNQSSEASQTIKLKKYRDVQWFYCRRRDCSHRFSTPAELRQHVADTGHLQIRPTTWRFKGNHHTQHKRTKVFGPDKPYRTCPVCQEQVANTHHLSLFRHHTVKHPYEPFTPACAPKENLCEHCGKSFMLNSSYHDHLNTHTGERPYACSECPKRFHSKHCLAQHRERHQPPRYECNFCGKKFRSASNRLVHKRTHTGERRFKCEICSKGFLHAGSLKEHVNGVHNHVRRVKKTKKTE